MNENSMIIFAWSIIKGTYQRCNVLLSLVAILFLLVACNSTGETSIKKDQIVDNSMINLSVRSHKIETLGINYNHIAWSPDGKYFALLGVDYNGTHPFPANEHRLNYFFVRIIEASSLNVVKTIITKDDTGFSYIGSGSIQFSPDGKILAAGYKVISLWDTQTWKPIKELVGHKPSGRTIAAGIQSFQFSNDSTSLNVYYRGLNLPDSYREEKGDEHFSSPSTVMSFDIISGKQTVIYTDHLGDSSLLNPIAFSRDGKYIYSTVKYSTDNSGKYERITIQQRDGKTGKVLKEINNAHVTGIIYMLLARDDNTLMTVSSYGTRLNYINDRDPIKFWDTNNFSFMSSLESYSYISKFTVSGDNDILVTQQYDKSNDNIWIRRLSDGKIIKKINLHNARNNLYSVSLSPNGKQLVATYNGFVSLFDLDY